MERSWLDEQRERYERAAEGSGGATGFLVALFGAIVCVAALVGLALSLFF